MAVCLPPDPFGKPLSRIDVPGLEKGVLLLSFQQKILFTDHTEQIIDVERHQPAGNGASRDQNQPYFLTLHQKFENRIKLFPKLRRVEQIQVVDNDDLLFPFRRHPEIPVDIIFRGIIQVFPAAQIILYKRRFAKSRHAVHIYRLAKTLGQFHLFYRFLGPKISCIRHGFLLFTVLLHIFMYSAAYSS